jgi:predicted O-methyltransferase YrrM
MSALDTMVGIVNKTLVGEHDSDQHTLTLFAIALQIKAKEILELGVRDGDTTEPLLLAAHMNGGKLNSVDIEPTNWKASAELAPHWNFNQQDAITFLSNCVANNTKFDLIFVDDLHKYEHVKKELELIDKIVDEKTVILLHDLMGEGNFPNYFLPISPHYNGQVWEGGGPFRAVNELDKNIWEWSTIPVNHGLTILRKRSKVVTPFS